MAKGAAMIACAQGKVSVFEYNPSQVKAAVTGNGHASKQQVQRMVQNILKLKNIPEPADISDALAMAISYCYINGVQGAGSRDKA